MGELRLKGQEVQMQVTAGGQVVDAFTAVASFNDSMKTEKLEEGFLGETTNRHDYIFNGWDGSFEMQVHKNTWANFQAQVQAKARRTQPDLVFNVVRTDFYSDGSTLTRTYLDVAWGPNPTSVASRGDYVKISWDFSADETDDDVSGIL